MSLVARSVVSFNCARNALFRADIRVCKRFMSDLKPVEKVDAPQAHFSPMSSLGGVHKVNRAERYFLVWTKKFKSVSEVPAYISRDMMERCRNIMRIRINLSIMAVTLLGAFVAVQLGKSAADRGETLTKYSREWHQSYNDQKNKEIENSKSA